MTATSVRYDLERFLLAQAGVHERAEAELRAGEKRSHWMWFVFPQIRGLGSSEMAARYALSSLDEARAYLHHPVLGPRLREITRIVLEVQGRSAEEIFGYPDDLKFHSCMTLFCRAAHSGEDHLFREALDRYFGGKEDEGTLQRI